MPLRSYFSILRGSTPPSPPTSSPHPSRTRHSPTSIMQPIRSRELAISFEGPPTPPRVRRRSSFEEEQQQRPAKKARGQDYQESMAATMQRHLSAEIRDQVWDWVVEMYFTEAEMAMEEGDVLKRFRGRKFLSGPRNVSVLSGALGYSTRLPAFMPPLANVDAAFWPDMKRAFMRSANFVIFGSLDVFPFCDRGEEFEWFERFAGALPGRPGFVCIRELTLTGFSDYMDDGMDLVAKCTGLVRLTLGFSVWDLHKRDKTLNGPLCFNDPDSVLRESRISELKGTKLKKLVLAVSDRMNVLVRSREDSRYRKDLLVEWMKGFCTKVKKCLRGVDMWLDTDLLWDEVSEAELSLVEHAAE